MQSFTPKYVMIRENALDYPLGQKMYEYFQQQEDVEVHKVASRGGFPLDNNVCPSKKFIRAKQTLVVSVKKASKFQSCKPSAHYQLPLVTGCPGHCHYCYLNTNLGKNPYIKVYVNIEEMLEKAKKYMKERAPEVTIFEGSATSDPLPIERYSGLLAHCIKYFANEELGSFRFVTKYSEVDSLLDIDHKGKTEFRFSLNSSYAIKKFEPTTPNPEERIEAATKVYNAKYPTGFLIAPIFIYDGWQKDYEDLIKSLQKKLGNKGEGISFELITHRYTERAKKIIEEVYPGTELPMNEEARQFKYGQFGYGKYVYPKEKMQEIEEHMQEIIKKSLPESEIKYFV
ncbi:spore photoproduct lyase [Natronospora cellulosivora (SeqCode)]